MAASRDSAVYEGTLLDDHELSVRSRAYGEWVVRGSTWPLSDIDLSNVAWETSTRARRRHGRCSYERGGRCTITISERTYDRAGFEGCEATIRHELVHVWQHQHIGEWVTDLLSREVEAASDGRIERGHGTSFRLWVDPLDLQGRCSSPYEPTRDDYAYVYECPSCRRWWGKHRLCKSVRQAAHGVTGSDGYRYCTACETLVHLRAGAVYLSHGRYEDEMIRAFTRGEHAAVSIVAVDRLHPTTVPDSSSN